MYMISEPTWFRFRLRRVLIATAILAVILTIEHLIGSLDGARKSGNAVVAALETYRADYKSYPERLSELCPRYLQAIPTPPWGRRKWQYELDADEFKLSVENLNFGNANAHRLYYWSSTRRWEVQD
jgi:hypothetical protein